MYQIPEISREALFKNLYLEGIIQTLWKARHRKNQEEGWTLKNGSWSPWFFNLRPIGSFPLLYLQMCELMADVLANHDFDFLLGIEMAGIQPVGTIQAIMLKKYDKLIPAGYTRPLPQKARTPKEAVEILDSLERVGGYGQKELVEGEIEDGSRVAIFDDMATDLGSKIIARLILMREAEKRGLEISCEKIFYFLNRNKSSLEKSLYFPEEKEEFYPGEIELHYLWEFEDYFPFLENLMAPQEFKTLREYQKNKDRFQDPKLIQETLNLVPRA